MYETVPFVCSGNILKTEKKKVYSVPTELANGEFMLVQYGGNLFLAWSGRPFFCFPRQGKEDSLYNYCHHFREGTHITSFSVTIENFHLRMPAISFEIDYILKICCIHQWVIFAVISWFDCEVSPPVIYIGGRSLSAEAKQVGFTVKIVLLEGEPYLSVCCRLFLRYFVFWLGEHLWAGFSDCSNFRRLLFLLRHLSKSIWRIFSIRDRVEGYNWNTWKS